MPLLLSGYATEDVKLKLLLLYRVTNPNVLYILVGYFFRSNRKSYRIEIRYAKFATGKIALVRSRKCAVVKCVNNS